MCSCKELCLLLIFVFIGGNYGAKILGVFPFAAHSHFTLGFNLMKELVDRGHEVTFINAYPQKTPIKNLTDVSTADFIKYMDEQKKQLFDLESQSFWTWLIFVNQMGNTMVKQTLENKNVQNLLKSNAQFDVVILEQIFSEGLMGFAHHYKAPLIIFTAMGTSSWTNPLVGNPAPMSYSPNIFSKFTAEMSFFQRVQNVLYETSESVYKALVALPEHNRIMKQYFPTAPELSEIMYNVSAILLNSHVSTNNPKPHLPNMIEIGGFHVQKPKKLPNDLQQFLDNAKEGVVYFSLGTNLKSSALSAEKRDAILKSFAKLKQKVLWKWESDVLPGQPSNVKLGKWFPQSDILAHPNVHVFITHGGLLSTIETISRGVPVIGIPVFGDQIMNIGLAVQSGYALSVPFSELTEENLSWALEEILNNPKYRENVKKRSTIMNDRVVKPIDEAVYWVEYVIRHQGGAHFRSPALNLTWYQHSLLDVFLFIATVILSVFLVLKKLLSKLKRNVKKVDVKKKTK